MRVTGGEFGGRKIRVPKTLVRPTQDRVREALFSSLGERLSNARVLDLFAGSGALGLDAYSRGARSVTWIEEDAQVFRVLRDNVSEICGDGPNLRCVQRDVYRFLKQDLGERNLDLVFADPPYEAAGGDPPVEKLLQLLGSGSSLKPTGCFVMEQARNQVVPEPEGWSLARNKTYGKTRLLMYIRGFPTPTGDPSP